MKTVFPMTYGIPCDDHVPHDNGVLNSVLQTSLFSVTTLFLATLSADDRVLHEDEVLCDDCVLKDDRVLRSVLQCCL